MKTALIWGGAFLVLGTANSLILHKEHLLAHGEVMLLELAPRDPRSLMQGDYMVLDYALARDEILPGRDRIPASGHLVVTLDQHHAAHLERLHQGEPLAPGEHLLRFRYRGRLRLGAESFFFQEGNAGRYEEARYGELRVAPSGTSVLVGLRGADREPL